jgi:radical SAM superfamily enzyme YgiQ (UPF0313 family)
MNKKILLLRAKLGIEDPFPPLAFSYLGAIAKKEGFEVLVENLNAQYTKKDYKSIIDLIKREKPRLVGMNFITNSVTYSYDLLEKIRPYCKIIVAGGPHATICPEEVLEKGADIIVLGEAEISFKNLLGKLSQNKKINSVKGLVFREKGKIVKTKPEADIKDLNVLPIPDREVHRQSDYVKIKEEMNNYGAVLSSRGCTGRCTFCLHSLFGKCFRFRSADKILEEILQLHKKYGVTTINFVDDSFTANRKRLNQICDMLIEKKLPIEWVCASRIDFLTRETIFKMKKAGCVMISLGFESMIPKTLEKTKKTLDPQKYIEQTERVLKWCHKAGIRAGVNTLVGFPWETAEEMRDFQKYVKKIRKYVTQCFDGGIIQPYPGTEIYNEYANECGFEKWWLYKKRLFKDEYRPFFMIYYHTFWDHLHNNFFNYDKKIFREIDKLYKIMGKWDLYIISKRRFKNPLFAYFVYQALLFLSNFSLFLFNVSPKLEKTVMERVKKFSYKFKFRKGTENKDL